MAKSGAFKTGEGITGDSLAVILSPDAQTLSLSTPTPDATGTGTVTVAPETQQLSLYPIGTQGAITSRSGQSKTGEFVSGGATNPGLDLLSQVVFRPEMQTLSLSWPTPTATGTGTVGLSPNAQTLLLSAPTPNVGYSSWVLDNDSIGRVTGERATHQTLSLTTRVDSETLAATLRALKTDEGKVEVIGTDDGGYRAVDRANGGNSFILLAPIQRQPLRRGGTVHVARYEETLVSQDVGEWDVEIEFQHADERTDTPSLSETADANEWGLETRYGTVATERVDADVVGTGEAGVERFELQIRLTFSQAHVFEAALNRLGAGRVREIPDAPNQAIDDSTDGAATVTVNAPDGQDTVADGAYVVQEWESTRLTDTYQEISVTIAAV